jgi:type IV secretory pathway VirB2 component (pilin)
MHHLFSLRTLSRLSAVALALPLRCAASVWSGGGEGLGDAEGINTGGSGNLRESIWTILERVLSYMGLAAVIVIVIAGIYLLVGGGADESRQKAIKIVLYTIIGIIVIMLASAFVHFIVNNAQ